MNGFLSMVESAGGRRMVWFWCVMFLVLLAAKLCQLDILWAEEGYGSAAAVQILHGKMLYRDFWFDKPPLAALLYVLWHGHAGFGLRLADAIYALLCAGAAFRFAKHLWGEREAKRAACLMAFFLVFDIPSQVTTLGPDLLLVFPAILAVDCAVRKRAFWSGIWCALGLAANAKAVLIAAVCVVWCWPQISLLAAGFVVGCAPWAIWLAATGAFPAYWQQVWWFGSRYSRDTFVANPLKEGLLRTAHWLGFHAALVAGVVFALCARTIDRKTAWIAWFAAAAIGIVAGERYFGRYYFILLPPTALLAARGLAMARKQWQVAELVLLAIPLIRFGPRYVLLAQDALQFRPSNWSDVQLNEDSQEVSRFINFNSKAGDTLLVWGYRPDIFAYTQMPVAGRFLDSQMLTGVLADRHLTSTHVTFPGMAGENRQHLIRTRPNWIVDGLALMNPALAITSYPELKPWLSENCTRLATTRNSVIYALKP